MQAILNVVMIVTGGSGDDDDDDGDEGPLLTHLSRHWFYFMTISQIKATRSHGCSYTAKTKLLYI
jgi:hypothetical protein